MSSTFRQKSPLADLLENLIKHGTMPGMPIPKSIIDAQLELAEKNVTIDFMEKEINRLQAIEAAARKVLESARERTRELDALAAALEGKK